jgi:enoyl-CoA hydratase/carnithine racemase
MKPHNFDSYKDRYDCISLDRTDDGIVTIKFHNPEDPDGEVNFGQTKFGWNHWFIEWSFCYNDIAQDPDNEVAIITGTGNVFIGAEAVTLPGAEPAFPQGPEFVGKVPPTDANFNDWVTHACTANLEALLSINIPVIGAINGPALAHAEMGLLSDIVICSDNAEFQDEPHILSGLFAPGDGVNVVWPEWLGLNRGRHFLLTGRKLTPAEAVEFGIVSEIVPRAELMPRAMEIAQELLKRPRLVRRYARQIMVRDIKKKIADNVPYSIALENLAAAGRRLDSDPPFVRPWAAPRI